MSAASHAGQNFSSKEREYLRRELDMFFSTYPTVAEGLFLRTWRGGPQAGQPKVPPAAASILARGWLRLDANLRPPRLFFTPAGLSALRAMMADRRLADPKTFAHVRRELGIDPTLGDTPLEPSGPAAPAGHPPSITATPSPALIGRANGDFRDCSGIS